MWRKNFWCLGIIFFILLSSYVSASSCDWEIKILMDGYVFNESGDVNWVVKVFRNEGENADLDFEGYVKDVLSNWTRNYNRHFSNVVNYRNVKYDPNLWQGSTYLIWFNISELNCSDNNLDNNFDSKLVMVLPKYIGEDYNKIKINEFLPNPEGYDNEAMPGGEWIELYNSGSEVINVSGLILNDEYGNGVVISDVNVLNSTIIEPDGFLVVYRNGDGKLELNNDGFDKVRLFVDNFLVEEVGYSGSWEGVSWSKIAGIWKRSMPSPGFENIGNESVMDSFVEIDKIYDLGEDKIAKFGQIIRVKINLYKGDDTENVIKVLVKDGLSKQSKISVFTKFTNYTITVPVQIYPNCDGKFEDGTYDVLVDGFGDEDSKKIDVEGITEDLCEEIEVCVKEDKEEVICMPTEVKGGDLVSVPGELISGDVVYESKSVKAKKSAIWFFCGLLILILVFLIWRKSF